MKTYKNILKNENWILFKKMYFYPHIMRVKVLLTNEIITAESNFDLVFRMWKQSFLKEKTMLEYMVSYARRSVNYYNHDIRATGVDEFVEDLTKHRHIEIV